MNNKKRKILILIISVILFLIISIILYKYFSCVFPLRNCKLTYSVGEKLYTHEKMDNAFVYNCAKMKGHYLESSKFNKVLLVTDYKDDKNYYAAVEINGEYSIVQLVDGSMKKQVLLPSEPLKIAKFKDNILFSLNDEDRNKTLYNLYSADIQNGTYELITKEMEDYCFWVNADKILFRRERDNGEYPWFIMSESGSETELSRDFSDYSTVVRWYSENKFIVSEYDEVKDICIYYIYDLDNGSKEEIKAIKDLRVYDFIYVSGTDVMIISKYVSSEMGPNQKTMAVNLKNGQKIRLFGNPDMCQYNVNYEIVFNTHDRVKNDSKESIRDGSACD